mmetsp:Transcript_29863/g.71982  ORF Transcript_29863/g.71982 Transcript_29863/m.71982 type:complete len:232 (-) Transcript_29863:472-1167(-)
MATCSPRALNCSGLCSTPGGIRIRPAPHIVLTHALGRHLHRQNSKDTPPPSIPIFCRSLVRETATPSTTLGRTPRRFSRSVTPGTRLCARLQRSGRNSCSNPPQNRRRGRGSQDTYGSPTGRAKRGQPAALQQLGQPGSSLPRPRCSSSSSEPKAPNWQHIGLARNGRCSWRRRSCVPCATQPATHTPTPARKISFTAMPSATPSAGTGNVLTRLRQSTSKGILYTPPELG